MVDIAHPSIFLKHFCGKAGDNFTTLAESFVNGIAADMAWDSATSNIGDMAARIANLQREELDKFFRDHLKRRDLHLVVANLNETALSKDNPRSEHARVALRKLGFTE
ncbi:MAG: hypothetical protein AAF230_05260 [Pseudomonadota bacterium]